jgi:6-phosphogluconate dehydrogenase
VVMSMVQAGEATDAVIEEILPHLDAGDVLIDGGNANFRDTQRRHTSAAERGVHFLGVGVSGGEDGALNGPSIMPGGDREPYDESVKAILEAIAAQVDGTPCCTYVGPDGAGHYVKMVHNGIEYADMQLIAESYDLLRHGAGLEVPEIAERFEVWNKSELESYLIEISVRVLAKTDESTGQPLVDVILDAAEQKGTGRWTAQNALELGVPLTGITEAVFARTLSALRTERVAAAGQLAGPSASGGGDARLADDLEHALYASKIVSYAQGFAQMAAASEDEGWSLDLGAMATIWRGGCIIRARFLDRIKEAYDDGEVVNLLTVPYFRDAVASGDAAWRRVINAAVDQGVAVPAFTSSLAYYDGYRREHGPAGLIQGLRDYFGAHTYRRTDAEGSYHVRWPQDGEEVRTDG